MTSFVPLGEQQEDEAAIESIPTRDKVIGLINEAQLVTKEKKLSCLNQVKELIINKEPDLLDSFLDEMIAFQADSSPDIRKFVITFMEEAIKSDPGLLVRVIPIVAYMLEDDSTVVMKRLLASIIHIYRLSLMHIAKMKVMDSDAEEMWEILQDMKLKVCAKVESENDGVRTITIKFMEFLILAQTKKEQNSDVSKSALDISLDIVPSSHPMLDPADLREEAGTTMGSLLQMTVSPVISSVNLMTCITSLAIIAKQRPSYITTVIQAFELLHANLPPHFATSQISSVRKQLKTQVLGLLKQPSSFECREQITTLLTDLGCTQAEIARSTPKMSHDTLKRSRSEMDSASKKVHHAPHDGKPNVTSRGTPTSEGGGGGGEKLSSGSAIMEAIEMTTKDLRPLLTPEGVTELVIANIKNVPSTQPKYFGNSYTPIAAAGTDAQILHLARLLASQMTTAGIGVGAVAKGIKPQQQQSVKVESPSPRETSPIVRDPRKRRREKDTSEGGGSEEVEQKPKKIKEEVVEGEEGDARSLEKSMEELKYLGSLLGLPDMMSPAFPLAYANFFRSGGAASAGGIGEGTVSTENKPVSSNLVEIPTSPSEDSKELTKEKEKKKLQVSVPQKPKRILKLDLISLVRPLDEQNRKEMILSSFERILESEKSVVRASQSRIKIIVNLVAMFGSDFSTSLLEFILADFRSRFDIAIAWLYAEYSAGEGYLHSGGDHASQNYSLCLSRLMLGTKAKLDPRDRLFTKLVLEAPKITFEALDIIKSYCQEEDRAFLGVTTLKELVLRRPQGPEGTKDFLQALLEITISTIELARIQAMHIAKKFYGNPELSMKIERFALEKLQLLLQDHPTFDDSMGDIDVAEEWTESSVKMCFSLFVALLPLNHKLLRDLAFVYTSTSPNVKRIILRQLDQPVRSIGMKSSELLQLVESCPRGGETLIMRMLHILTEGATPSAELVNRVRELYHNNSSDVRFLIPILHGLNKQDVVSALPKFVKLSPGLVKGVMDRLLVSHRGESGHSISPITPSELLIALHYIDCQNDESMMKSVIKATNLCFQEKTLFTQEVLAVVLQQMLERDPIPVLFMRTVLQSLSICPKLISFVMNILIKLINKQVWKQPKVLWQGFIKCCEVTKPHSFQVLLRLPHQQLEKVLEQSPGLRPPLLSHIQKLPPQQLASVHLSVLQTIEGSEVVKKSKSEKSKRRQSSRSDRSDSKESSINQENLDS